MVTTAILQKRFMSINVDISQAHNLRKKYVLLEADPSMHLPASSARSGLNSKIISFVRHAEGIHNAAASEHKDEFYAKLYNSRILWDSPLTQTGAEQCEKLRSEIESSGLDVDVTFVSPLFRTLQTAMLSFGISHPKTPMIAQEMCRERMAIYASEGRSPTRRLRVHFPKVDFSQVTAEEDEWWPQTETDEQVGLRGLVFLDYLMAQPYQRIAVVSHSVFLQCLYNEFRDSLPPHFYTERQGFAALRTVTACRAME